MGEIREEHASRGVFTFLFSFVFSLLFMAAIYFAVIVISTGDWLLRLVSQALPSLAGLGIWSWLRFPLMLLVFVFILYGLYRLTAPREAARCVFSRRRRRP